MSSEFVKNRAVFILIALCHSTMAAEKSAQDSEMPDSLEALAKTMEANPNHWAETPAYKRENSIEKYFWQFICNTNPMPALKQQPSIETPSKR